MKKMAICLMVACLSLFANSYELNAGSLAGPKDKTELPVIPPALEKQINKFRENHPGMFTKKDNRDDVEKTAQETKKSMGLIGFAISVGMLVLIILLIMMLV